MDHEGLAKSGINRRLNRHKFSQTELDANLNDPGSRSSRVLSRYKQLLKVRASHPAFHPDASQEIKPSRQVLHIVRGATLHCLINVSGQMQSVGPKGKDLISGKAFDGTLAPYQAAWVTAS